MRIAAFFFMSSLAMVTHQMKYSNRFGVQMQYHYPFVPSWAMESYYQYMSNMLNNRKLTRPNLNKGMIIDEDDVIFSPTETNEEETGVTTFADPKNLMMNYLRPKTSEKVSPRFFNLGNQINGHYNPLIKTVYYIVTDTATSAVVTTCIPANLLGGLTLNICARKRRDEIESLESLSDEIVPSETEKNKVTPTGLPDAFKADVSHAGISLDFTNYDHLITSSKDDNFEELENFHAQSKNRDKRFFALFTTTITITSYSFTTTVITKSLTNFGVSVGCRPQNFGVC